ncbi:substrate-binding domain-containing protein [Butyrivibrio sp. AE3006]|uniref:substrate-binding domain-containing protein n=1 Tax=Butyrivibrio sp. AE3006 TaxID=1280673 RepID=UPI0009DBF8AA|nr:substrate-binding domain-containing protein [Butyrivibrio sp. AE3006]
MSTHTSSEKSNKKMHGHNFLLFTTVLFTIATLVVGALVFRFYMEDFRKSGEVTEYDKYYVMITDNYKADFWQSVYKGAFEAAKEQDTYIDLLGENLDRQYSCEELMKIAIASKVDGIIVYANESDEMTNLINEATQEGIPVVTLYGDNTHSGRISFVGVGSYNIGREYGRQVFNIIKEKRREDFKDSEKMKQRKSMEVTVLVNTDAQDSGQNIIISALQETLSQENATNSEFNISVVPVDNKNAFSVEESIRDIFLNEKIPDVIICLNELNTVCAYQAVVDFNKVGDVSILGYYDSESIVSAIDKGIVYATISIDTAQMGQYCVEALSDYHEFGTTSQYFTADVTLINGSNVADFLKKEEIDE